MIIGAVCAIILWFVTSFSPIAAPAGVFGVDPLLVFIGAIFAGLVIAAFGVAIPGP